MASHLATERMEHTPSVLPVLMVDQSDATGQQLISTAEYSAFMDWTNDTMDATKAKVRFYYYCTLLDSSLLQLSHFRSHVLPP